MLGFISTLFLAVLIVYGIALLPAYARQAGFRWWECLLPGGGLFVWVALEYLRVGTGKSMSNGALEIMLLAGLAIIVGWIAAFIPVKRRPELQTYRAFLLSTPIVFAILLRFLVPTLPE